MKPDLAAKQYTQALWTVAEKINATNDVLDSLTGLKNLLKTESVFRTFLQSANIKTDDKISILSDVFSGSISDLVLELIKLLDEAKEIALLGRIADHYIHLHQEKSNIVPVTVSSHTELEEEEVQSICTLLEKATGKTVAYSSSVDPSLLGGIKLRIGNIMVDGSLAIQMEKLRQKLIH